MGASRPDLPLEGEPPSSCHLQGPVYRGGAVRRQVRSAFELKRVFRLPDSMSGPGKTGHPGLGDADLDL